MDTDIQKAYKSLQPRIFDARKKLMKKTISPYTFHYKVNLDLLVQKYTKDTLTRIMIKAIEIAQREHAPLEQITQKHIIAATEQIKDSVTSEEYPDYSFREEE